jgi:hypothetical protein
VDQAQNFLAGIMTIMFGYVENLEERLMTTVREMVGDVELVPFMLGMIFALQIILLFKEG